MIEIVRLLFHGRKQIMIIASMIDRRHARFARVGRFGLLKFSTFKINKPLVDAEWNERV